MRLKSPSSSAQNPQTIQDSSSTYPQAMLARIKKLTGQVSFLWLTQWRGITGKSLKQVPRSPNSPKATLSKKFFSLFSTGPKTSRAGSYSRSTSGTESDFCPTCVRFWEEAQVLVLN